MSLARLVVTAVRIEGRSKSAVAREYQISRRWVHGLVCRFDAEGEAGPAPRSRRPRTCPVRPPVRVEEAIVGWRKRLSEHGLDAGAATIAVHLAGRFGQAPSTATIWPVLSRRGMVVPQPHKRPRSTATPLALSPNGAAAAPEPPALDDILALDGIVALLASGMQDEAAARQLGVSARTRQRRLQVLFAQLGSRTRFQAGFRAGPRAAGERS
jgi:transposase